MKLIFITRPIITSLVLSHYGGTPIVINLKMSIRVAPKSEHSKKIIEIFRKKFGFKKLGEVR